MVMRIFPQFLLVMLASHAAPFVAPVLAAPPGYNLAKEKGVIYLKDILEEDEKVTFKVIKATPVFSSKDAASRIGMIPAGRQVELEGFTRFALRVRGQGTQGMIVGWINPKDAEAPEQDMLETLRKMAERREAVAKLIKEKQVAIGMTPGEVEESRGQPTKRESQLTATGRTDIWEYIDYEIIPRYDVLRDPVTGAAYRRFAYNEKIEKGKTTIEFKDGAVSGIAEKEDLSRKKDLMVVPLPLEFSWP